MKIRVYWLNKERTRAEVLIVPSWFGRLFGAKQRRGVAVERGKHPGWFWEAGDRMVDELLGYANYVSSGPITRALRGEQSAPTVEALPAVSVVVAPPSDVSK